MGNTAIERNQTTNKDDVTEGGQSNCDDSITTDKTTGRGESGEYAENGNEETTGKEETLVVGKTVLTEEEKKEQRNQKRRERYAQNKDTSPKPKKVGNGKKLLSKAENTQVTMILTTMSTIVSSRKGFEMFALTSEEIKSLADPISNMLANSESLKLFNDHPNEVALITAVFTIFVPRCIMYISTKPKKERKVTTNGDTKSTDESRNNNEKTKANIDHRASSKNVTNASTNHVKALYIGDAIA